MIRRIVVMCMDWRLNEQADNEYNDDETIFIRGAGPFVKDLIPSIEKVVKDPNNDVNEIVVVTHNDCGAAKVIYGALAGEIDINGASLKDRVKLFNDIETKGRDRKEVLVEIEERIMDMQERDLEVFKKMGKGHGIEIISEHAQVEEHVGRYDKRAVITEPSTRKFEELVKERNLPNMGTYFVQAYSRNEIKRDMEMADKLGVSEFKGKTKTKNGLW